MHKRFKLVGGERSDPSPHSNMQEKYWESGGSGKLPNNARKELIPFQPPFRLLIPRFKDCDHDKNVSESPPKGELGVGGKFEYP